MGWFLYGDALGHERVKVVYGSNKTQNPGSCISVGTHTQKIHTNVST